MSGSTSKPQLIWGLKGGLDLGEGRGRHCYEVLRNTTSFFFFLKPLDAGQNDLCCETLVLRLAGQAIKRVAGRGERKALSSASAASTYSLGQVTVPVIEPIQWEQCKRFQETLNAFLLIKKKSFVFKSSVFESSVWLLLIAQVAELMPLNQVTNALMNPNIAYLRFVKF